VQLDEVVVVRRTGDGETASLAAGQQHIEVLSGVKAQPLDRGQPQQYLHDIGGEQVETRDARRERLDLDVGYARDEPRFDREVRQCARLAQENVSAALLFGRDAGRAGAGIADLALHEPRAAGAAVPGLAAVGQIQPRGERCLEHGLVLAHVQAARMWLDAYRVFLGAHCPRPVMRVD
jgi:hypothetical protein